MKITFLGATGTVTGSKYLFDDGEKNFLIDCGLFQGFKQLRLRNWQPLPVKPREIAAVVLTHAHLDHSGYLPLLVKNGSKARSIAARQPSSFVEFCSPIRGICRKKKPAMPTSAASQSTNRLYHCTLLNLSHER